MFPGVVSQQCGCCRPVAVAQCGCSLTGCHVRGFGLSLWGRKSRSQDLFVFSANAVTAPESSAPMVDSAIEAYALAR